MSAKSPWSGAGDGGGDGDADDGGLAGGGLSGRHFGDDEGRAAACALGAFADEFAANRVEGAAIRTGASMVMGSSPGNLRGYFSYYHGGRGGRNMR